MSDQAMSHHAGPDPTTIVFRVSPVALLAVAFLLVGLSPAVLAAPLLFTWLLVVPIFAAVWIIRVRTTVDANGLRVRGVATTREVTWEAVGGGCAFRADAQAGSDASAWRC